MFNLNFGNNKMCFFSSAMKSLLESGLVTTKPPDKFRLITWNIDGLEEKNLKKRTKAVLKTIEQ